MTELRLTRKAPRRAVRKQVKLPSATCESHINAPSHMHIHLRCEHTHSKMSISTFTTLHTGSRCHTIGRLPNFVLSQASPHHFQRQSLKDTFQPNRRQPARAGCLGHAAKLSVHAAADPVVANTSHKVTTSQFAALEPMLNRWIFCKLTVLVCRQPCGSGRATISESSKVVIQALP